MSTAAPSSIISVSELATSLDSTLDKLQAALAKLQGPVEQPGSSSSPLRTEADAGRRLSDEFSSLSADTHTQPVEPALIDTPTIHEHLRRLYVYFCSSPASSDTQNRDVGSRTPMLSTYGFAKLARAAQLIGDRCSPVDVDLVFCKVESCNPMRQRLQPHAAEAATPRGRGCNPMHLAWHQPYACQVVKSRASRMGLADMVRGLAILALRLYPELDTQAEAFHRLLSDHLLPWMLQLEAALVECQLGAAPLGLLFERHAPFTQLVFDTYLSQPARPLSTAVAALPMQLLQWPQLVAFAQDFELCPALVGWPQLARQFCFVGTCAVPHQWQRPEVHGLTLTLTFTLTPTPTPKPDP